MNNLGKTSVNRHRIFVRQWVAMLWKTMQQTGNGYRRHSLRHTGRGEDRRNDKLDGSTKKQRQYRNRYA